MSFSLKKRFIPSANHLLLQAQNKLKTCLPLGQPVLAMVELCNVCNLQCKLCPSGNNQLDRPVGMMKESVFQDIIDQLDDTYTRHLIPVMWGESMLHPKFIELMNYARKKSWKISVPTNGNISGDDQYFDDLVATGIDEIVCAIDGHNQDIYEQYRSGGSLEKVHNFLINISRAKERASTKKPHVVAQVLLFKGTERHLQDIEKNIGSSVDEIRTKLARMFFTDEDKKNDLVSVQEKLRPENEENRFPSEGRPICPAMLYYVNINWEGEVIACCKDPKNHLRFGKVQKGSIAEIRKSKKFRETKQKLLRGDYEYEVCKKCYLV